MKSELKYKIQIFKSDDPTELSAYEDIKTKLANEDLFEQVKEETTFTKEGTYIIALHWIETGTSFESKEKIKKMIENE